VTRRTEGIGVLYGRRRSVRTRYWMAAILALTTLAANAAAANAAPPLSWSPSQQIDHQPPYAANFSVNGLSTISCPEEAFCAAADFSGNVLTSTDPTGGAATWTVTHLEEGSTVNPTWGGSGFDAISCPSASFCAAADVYGKVWTSSDPSGGVSAWHSAQVLGTESAIRGISCPTASFCVVSDADGHIATSSNPTGGASAWTSFQVGSFSSDSFGDLDCLSATFCAAADQPGSVAISTDPAGGASAWKRTLIDSHGVPLSIACPTTSLCLAGDSQGHVFSSNDPNSSPGAWSDSGYLGTSAIESLSCPSMSLCVLGDEEGAVATSRTPTGPASTWTPQKLTGGDLHVSCPSQELCLTVEWEGNLFVGTPSVEEAAPLPAPPPAPVAIPPPVSAPLPPPPSSPAQQVPKPKPLKCKLHFKKRRVRGKLRCVRVPIPKKKVPLSNAGAISPLAPLMTVLSPSDAEPLEHECVSAALAKPEITSKPVMSHSGIRVGDPHRWQILRGAFEYASLPEDCAPHFLRTSTGELEIKKSGKWVKIGPPSNPVVLGNDQQHARLNYSPSHARPSYVYVDCVAGHFQLARIVLENDLRSGDNGQRQVVAQAQYILPIKDEGSCRAAVKSRQHYGNSDQ
jgi:hypothetical protein